MPTIGNLARVSRYLGTVPTYLPGPRASPVAVLKLSSCFFHTDTTLTYLTLRLGTRSTGGCYLVHHTVLVVAAACKLQWLQLTSTGMPVHARSHFEQAKLPYLHVGTRTRSVDGGRAAPLVASALLEISIAASPSRNLGWHTRYCVWYPPDPPISRDESSSSPCS